MMSEVELIQQANNDAITKEITNLKVINYDTVSELIPTLIANGSLILNSTIYTPADVKNVMSPGVGRYLVYDNPDKLNPFSIWAFAFAPRQKTSIHDHKYKGTVIVLEEPVTEKFYKPTGEASASLVDRCDRYRFHTNRDDLNSQFVHQLKRRKALGEGISVTLHIYNMEAQFINSEGNLSDRRNLDHIYEKESIFNKSSIPPYRKEEHPDFITASTNPY